MKNFTIKLNIETIIKAVVVGFIAFTLIAVTLAAFKDLTILNRAF